MTKDTFGPTSWTPFAHYDQGLRSWRTSQGTLVSGSIKYSGTWPRAGSMRGGLAYARVTWVPRTRAIGCLSLLPTPSASDWKREDNPSQARRRSPGLTIVSFHFPPGGKALGRDETTVPPSGDTPTLF